MTPVRVHARLLLLALCMLPFAAGCDGATGPDVSAYAGMWEGVFSFVPTDASASTVGGGVAIQITTAGVVTGGVALDDGRQGSITARLLDDGTLNGTIDEYALRGTLTRQPDSTLRGVLAQSLGSLVVGTITVTLERT